MAGLDEIMSKEDLVLKGFKKTGSPDYLYKLIDGKFVFYQKQENGKDYQRINAHSAFPTKTAQKMHYL